MDESFDFVKRPAAFIRSSAMWKWAAPFGLIASCGLAAIFFLGHSSSGNLPVDRIVIAKGAHLLSTFRSGRVLKTYRVALGQNPVGAKEQEGDMRTPEGTYFVDGRNAASDYHLALHLSYPSPAERERAAARGVDPGFDIEIHGLPNGRSANDYRPGSDWTAGCIALTDKEIEELWRVAPIGTVVQITP
jgi:murein L,D-transpeptidase YafK